MSKIKNLKKSIIPSQVTLTSEKHLDWKTEFDQRFTREDGLIDKYQYDEDGDPESTPETIKRFIFQLLSKQREELKKKLPLNLEGMASSQYVAVENYIERVKRARRWTL